MRNMTIYTIYSLQSEDSIFVKCEPHEILSYFIVKSDAFTSFFKKYVLNPYSIEINLSKVANMIIGICDDPRRLFVTHIISGSFDADKLDYIPRDGYFTGLRLVIDLDRLFYALSVREFTDKDKTCDLVVESPNPAEQILFSKMLLYSTIYHHHKVKACDCMLQGLVESMNHEGTALRRSPLVDPVDFLLLTDDDLFTARAKTRNRTVDKLIADLTRRNLFKRALVICKDTVTNYEDFRQYQLLRLSESPGELFRLRAEILNRLPGGERPSVHEVWIDLPSLPPLHEEATQTWVSVAKGEPVSLNLLFPVAGWLGAYADQKWRGHVFCPERFQSSVHEAARAVLTEYGLNLNDKSRTYCHL